MEMKRDAQNMPYDPKKSYYFKDEKGNFGECILESIDGGKATVMCGHEVLFRIFPLKQFRISIKSKQYTYIHMKLYVIFLYSC